MRIALVSCRSLPDWEVDDRPLAAALQGRGVTVENPPWDAEVDWARFDAALIRTTWDYTARRDAFVAWAESLPVPVFNPASVVRWNTVKDYLDDLSRSGVAVVPTEHLRADEGHRLAALLAARGWERAFLKPLVGAAAEATCRFSRDDLAPALSLLAAQPGDRRFLLQPYLPSVEVEGEYSVVLVDDQLWHGVQKIPVPGDYRVQDDHGASDLPWQAPPEALAVVDQVRQALWERFGVLLYQRIDLLHDQALGWLVCEVELVEPSLFFRHGPATAERLADALLARLEDR